MCALYLSCPSANFALQHCGFVPCEWLAAKGLLYLRTSTSTKFNLKFSLLFSKKKSPGKLHFTFFHQKKLVRLFILKEVKPSPDGKIVKRLTFVKLVPPLQHPP